MKNAMGDVGTPQGGKEQNRVTDSGEGVLLNWSSGVSAYFGSRPDGQFFFF